MKRGLEMGARDETNDGTAAHDLVEWVGSLCMKIGGFVERERNGCLMPQVAPAAVENSLGVSSTGYAARKISSNKEC